MKQIRVVTDKSAIINKNKHYEEKQFQFVFLIY